MRTDMRLTIASAMLMGSLGAAAPSPPAPGWALHAPPAAKQPLLDAGQAERMQNTLKQVNWLEPQ